MFPYTSQIRIVNPESEVEISYPNTLTSKLSFVQLGYPVNAYSLLSFWFAFDLAFQVGSSRTYTELTDLSPRMVFMQDPVLLFGYVWSYKWYQFLFQQL